MNGKKIPVMGKSIKTQTSANMLRTRPYQVDSKKRKNNEYQLIMFFIIYNIPCDATRAICHHESVIQCGIKSV